MRNLLVLGSGRSGTSMVAGTLAASGWWVGEQPYAGREANPKGFFETAEINGVNEELLARALPAEARFEHGQRWLCTLPAGTRPQADAALEARIARLVARTPFAFKDPRLCLTLPAWEPLLPERTGRVCVFREPLATAASIVRECATAPYLAGLELDLERALEVWCGMYEHVLAQAGRGEWLFVHYDQMLTQDGLARLERFAEGALDRRFPEASLRRSRASGEAGPRASELYRELCARAGVASGPAPRATSAPAPELSVILCTYQRLEILQRSIAGFEAQDAAPGSFELVVVDDGCSDGTREWLDAHEFAVPARVLHKPNGGLASARNLGIEHARGRVLLFVNDDTLPFPDLVREHLRVHAELARAGREASVLGSFEQPSAHLSGALMRHLEDSGEVFRYHDMRAGELYDHNRFWTCNVSVAAARVREAGAFDERFRRYGCEDIDLGLRLERLGLRVYYHPGARAHHHHVLDFAALARRQRACSASFVHLFAKHPSELDHPDWSWLAGRRAEELRAELRRQAERRAQLERAVAALAPVDLAALEALGETALVALLRERLAGQLRELNALWWQEGLLLGLGELGLSGFDELRAREPRTLLGGLRDGGFGADDLRAQLALVRTEAERGESVLATLRAIGLGCALESGAPQFRELALELLNDLAVLRHGARDREGALALLRRACELDPRHTLARENLAAIEAQPAAALPAPVLGAPDELSPWVAEALTLAQKRAQLLRARVLEIGGAVPEPAARAAGVRTWTALYPGARPVEHEAYRVLDADARLLPFEDASFDVVFSSCAFEHIPDLGRALAEIVRVLRPGGRLVTCFAPIWSSALGHHLRVERPGGGWITGSDPVLPHFAHLLLSERELEWYLALVLGPALAATVVASVWHAPHLNRLHEEQYRRLFREAGFDAAGLVARPAWDPAHVPGPALRRELARAHPGAGSFATPGFEAVLVRRGRTITIGESVPTREGTCA